MAVVVGAAKVKEVTVGRDTTVVVVEEGEVVEARDLEVLVTTLSPSDQISRTPV